MPAVSSKYNLVEIYRRLYPSVKTGSHHGLIHGATKLWKTLKSIRASSWAILGWRLWDILYASCLYFAATLKLPMRKQMWMLGSQHVLRKQLAKVCGKLWREPSLMPYHHFYFCKGRWVKQAWFSARFLRFVRWGLVAPGA